MMKHGILFAALICCVVIFVAGCGMVAAQTQNHESHHAAVVETTPAWTDQLPGEENKTTGLIYVYPKGVGKVPHPLAYKAVEQLSYEMVVSDVSPLDPQSSKFLVELVADPAEKTKIRYTAESFPYKPGAKLRLTVQPWQLQVIACGGMRPADDAPMLYQVVSVTPVS